MPVKSAAVENNDESGNLWLNSSGNQNESSGDQIFLGTNQHKSGDQIRNEDQTSAMAVNLSTVVTHTDTDDVFECIDQQIRTTSDTSDTGFSSSHCTTEAERSSPELHRHHMINTEHSHTGRSTADSASVVVEHTAMERDDMSDGEEGIKRSSKLVKNRQASSKLPPAPSSRHLSASPSPAPRPLSAPIVYPSADPFDVLQPVPSHQDAQLNSQEARQSYSSDGKSGSAYLQTSELCPPHPHQRSAASTKPSKFSEPHMKTNISPRPGWSDDRELDSTVYSPSSDSTFHFAEDEPSFEVWVASSEAHRSVLSVVRYNGQFSYLEVSVREGGREGGRGEGGWKGGGDRRVVYVRTYVSLSLPLRRR